MWPLEAARATCGHLVTEEAHARESAFARDMARRAGLAGHIDLKVGDAVQMDRASPDGVDFLLPDLRKDLHVPCRSRSGPSPASARSSVADNVRAVRAEPEVTSVMSPVGRGTEIGGYEAGPALASAYLPL